MTKTIEIHQEGSMTPKEFRAEALKIELEMGTKCPSIHCCLTPDGKLSASIYTNWPMTDPVCRVHADTFDTLAVLIREAWKEHAAKMRTDAIEKMALEIINATARHGECNESHLRLKFSQQEILKYGTEATTRANAIGDLGPFAIVATASANAA